MASIPDNPVGFLSQDRFAEQMESIHPIYEDIGMAHYSRSLSKSINEIFLLKDQIKTTNKNNPVKLLKLQKKLAPIEESLRYARDNSTRKSYVIYSNSFEAPLPIILFCNSRRLDQNAETLKNFGAISGGKTRCQRLEKKFPTIQTGSIFSDSSWSLCKNDAFILGAIHSLKTIYCIGHLDEDLWDTENNRPKIYTREIAILYAAGYRQKASSDDMEKYGALFKCCNEEKARTFTFIDAINATQSIKLQDVQKMLDSDKHYVSDKN